MKRLRKSRFGAFSLYVLAVVCLFASPDAELFAQVPAEREKVKEKAYDTLAAPPNLQQGSLAGYGESGKIGQFLLEGSTDEKTGTAAYGWKGGQEEVRLLAKGALDKKTGTATPLTLDGLPAAATIELSFNRFQWRPPEYDDYLVLTGEVLKDACVREPAACPNDRSLWDDWVRACTPPTAPASCKNLCCEDLKDSAKRAECNPQPPPICARNIADFVNLPAKYKSRARRLLHLDDRIWFWGGSASAGRTSFDYLETGSLEPKSVARTAWSLGGRVGVFSSSFGFLIGSYSYQKAFKAGATATEVCQPLQGATAATCAEAVLKPPVEQVRSVLTFEVRRFFADGAAIAPAFQYDLKSKTKLVAVPVYFLKNKDGAANGGIRMAWQSDTKSVTLGVFIGAALKL